MASIYEYKSLDKGVDTPEDYNRLTRLLDLQAGDILLKKVFKASHLVEKIIVKGQEAFQGKVQESSATSEHAAFVTMAGTVSTCRILEASGPGVCEYFLGRDVGSTYVPPSFGPVAAGGSGAAAPAVVAPGTTQAEKDADDREKTTYVVYRCKDGKLLRKAFETAIAISDLVNGETGPGALARASDSLLVKGASGYNLTGAAASGMSSGSAPKDHVALTKKAATDLRTWLNGSGGTLTLYCSELTALLFEVANLELVSAVSPCPMFGVSPAYMSPRVFEAVLNQSPYFSLVGRFGPNAKG